MKVSAGADLLCIPDQGEDTTAFLDRVYDEMTALGLRRVWMTFDDESLILKVGWTMDLNENEEFMLVAYSALRSAIHAAGGGTPEWPFPKVSKMEEFAHA